MSLMYPWSKKIGCRHEPLPHTALAGGLRLVADGRAQGLRSSQVKLPVVGYVAPRTAAIPPSPVATLYQTGEKQKARILGKGLSRRVAATGGPRHHLLRLSRISRNNTTSSGVATGVGGAAGVSRLSRLTCLIIRKMMNARMMKLMATVMKLP